MDFSKFNEAINADQLKKDIKEAEENGSGFAKIPDGKYEVKLEKMELGTTKDGRPMFKAQLRIIEGEFKKQCLFVNRVLYGTKNDGNMIASAKRFLKSLCPSEDIEIDFDDYNQFADLVLDVAEDVADVMLYEIDYEEDAFESVVIQNAFEKY